VGRGASPAHTKAGELVATGAERPRSAIFHSSQPPGSRPGGFSFPANARCAGGQPRSPEYALQAGPDETLRAVVEKNKDTPGCLTPLRDGCWVRQKEVGYMQLQVAFSWDRVVGDTGGGQHRFVALKPVGLCVQNL
jgi:hypothetical protein